MNLQAPLEVGLYCEGPDSPVRFHVDAPDFQWVGMPRAGFRTGSESAERHPDLPAR